MKTETEKELFALNAWLVEHALGFKRVASPMKIVDGTFFWNKGEVLVHESRNVIRGFRPTTNPADAMAVLERCAEELDTHKDGNLTTISVRGGNGKWRFGSMVSYCDAPTLPLAICKFAKQLFSK